MLCRDGRTAGRQTPFQKAGGSNPSWVEDFFEVFLFYFFFFFFCLFFFCMFWGVKTSRFWSRLRGNGDHTPDPDLESFKTSLRDVLTRDSLATVCPVDRGPGLS